jgi:putative transposase
MRGRNRYITLVGGQKEGFSRCFLQINMIKSVEKVRGYCSRRNKKAAKKFFKKLLKGLRYVPRVLITDKLKSYAAAKREVMPSVEHRQNRYLNNRCENSHRPTRERERRMQRFKSPGHAQRFLSAYGPIASHFRPRRHLFCAPAYRCEIMQRFQVWREVTGTDMAA